MKKLLLLLAAVVTVLTAPLSAKVPENRFVIEGRLKNVPDSTVIGLYRLVKGVYHPLDADTLKNGRFEFSDTIGTEAKQLYISPVTTGFAQVSLEVWVVRGEKTSVSGTDRLVKTWTVRSKDPRQKNISMFLKAQEPELSAILTHDIDEARLIHHLYVELKGSEKHEKRIWSQIDSIRQLTRPLQETADRKKLDYMRKAPMSEYWLTEYYYFVKQLSRIKNKELVEKIKALAPRMDEADPDSERTIAINDMLSVGSPATVGDMMVDGTLYDTMGNKHSLSEFKGRYILLDFWSTYCGPCQQSVPEWNELVDRYADRLAAVGICSDEETLWKESVTSKKLKGYQWNQLMPEGAGLAPRYGVIGIPQYVLINPEGKIISTWTGYGKDHLIQNVSRHLD